MDRFKNLLSRLKNLILRGFAMFQDNNMSVYSGYATLFIVTAVFPCIILIISIVNLIPGYSAKDVADILFQILPDLGSIEDFAVSLLLDIKDQSGGLLASAAAVTTLWSASKGVMAIQKGLNQLDSEDVVSEAKDEAEVETKEDKKRGLLEKGIAIAKPILKRLAFTLMLIMIIFAKLPAKGRTLKSQLPDALATGICWFLFTELFAFFIPRFYHASNLYGSLASLFLVLLWLQFIVMILFAGGVLNRTLEERRQEGI